MPDPHWLRVKYLFLMLDKLADGSCLRGPIRQNNQHTRHKCAKHRMRLLSKYRSPAKMSCVLHWLGLLVVKVLLSSKIGRAIISDRQLDEIEARFLRKLCIRRALQRMLGLLRKYLDSSSGTR